MPLLFSISSVRSLPWVVKDTSINRLIDQPIICLSINQLIISSLTISSYLFIKLYIKANKREFPQSADLTKLLAVLLVKVFPASMRTFHRRIWSNLHMEHPREVLYNPRVRTYSSLRTCCHKFAILILKM